MMRHTWGVLWGLAAGAFLSVIWLALAWIWRHFGRDLVSWIVNNPSTGESGIGLFELVPPALGCAVYGFGLEWLGRRISDNRVSLRSEEHTSELQSLMRISYAVFCLNKNIPIKHSTTHTSL